MRAEFALFAFLVQHCIEQCVRLGGLMEEQMNRPEIELTPRSWTNFKGFHGKVQNAVQARGGE